MVSGLSGFVQRMLTMAPIDAVIIPTLEIGKVEAQRGQAVCRESQSRDVVAIRNQFFFLMPHVTVASSLHSPSSRADFADM